MGISLVELSLLLLLLLLVVVVVVVVVVVFVVVVVVKKNGKMVKRYVYSRDKVTIRVQQAH